MSDLFYTPLKEVTSSTGGSSGRRVRPRPDSQFGEVTGQAASLGSGSGTASQRRNLSEDSELPRRQPHVSPIPWSAAHERDAMASDEP